MIVKNICIALSLFSTVLFAGCQKSDDAPNDLPPSKGKVAFNLHQVHFLPELQVLVMRMEEPMTRLLSINLIKRANMSRDMSLIMQPLLPWVQTVIQGHIL